MRGGVFLYPRDTKDPSKARPLRLLYECNPIGMIIEQAGGRASTGEVPVLEVEPTSLHQRIGFVFGSREEVERIERYHAEPPPEDRMPTTRRCSTQRGLFRLPSEPRLGRTRAQHRREPDMSAKHPIIAITGSSGAGTTTVQSTFEQIFRREDSRRPSSRATASTATTAPR